MSKETSKAAVNLYGILDNELQRMHALMQTYLTLPQQPAHYNSAGGGYTYNPAVSNMPMIYQRIVEIQDLMLKALIAHDEVIQDKVAELALMGTKDEPNKD